MGKGLEKGGLEVLVVPKRHRETCACWGRPKLQKYPQEAGTRAGAQHPRVTGPEDIRD